MASKVEICNLALAAIRAKSINSIDESSLEAQQCKLHFDIARRFVIRDSPWKFAKKTAALQLLTYEPLQWAYAYAYPGDCLNIEMVTGDFAFKNPTDVEDRPRINYNEYVEPELAQPYEVLNYNNELVIATDLPEAYVVYTKDLELTTIFDDSFVMAFYFYLASLIAVPIMGIDAGGKARADALTLYEKLMSSAVASNMNEQKQIDRYEPKLVEVRK